MTTADPIWLRDATALPVAFAQVREDPLLDRDVVARVGAGAAVAMIASGGCTAALLAGDPRVRRLHLIDANPAQLALTRLKLRLLRGTPAERLALLGHAPADRAVALTRELHTLGLPADALGPPAVVAALGPDHAGRYERLFAALRDALGDAPGLDAALRLTDPVEQSRRVAPGTPLGDRLDAAFDEVMALPNLVRLFGAEATNNPVMPFARHFAGRVRHALATLPATDNPYLWQMLTGRYPAVRAPWLELPPTDRLPDVTIDNRFVAPALAATRSEFDFVHLSNVLDWLTPDAGAATLATAAAALRPGGWVFIRQLNSTLDVRGLGPQFDWDATASSELLARDRSFFYRSLHLGRRR
ncbi:DUF3419 family protein [bacterium]|nr:DUF3419 family protein [bacterium]